MQKVYRASWWKLLFFPLLFLGGGLAMYLSETEFVYRAGGVVLVLMSLYVFRVLINTKVIIGEEYLVSDNYLSSFKCRQIRIKWSDIAEIYTARGIIGTGSFTYVIPKMASKQGRSGLEYGDNGQRKETAGSRTDKQDAIMIPLFIRHYPELITEISKRAHSSSIDDETRKLIDGQRKKYDVT